MLRLACLALLAALPAAADPSFDCSSATTRAERTVCADPRLARKDTELAAAYRARRASASGAEGARLVADQRAWLARRDACGADRACLYQVYDDRTAALTRPALTGPLATVPGTLHLLTPDTQATLTTGDAESSVKPDGTIEMPRPDGSVAFYNPATGDRGVRNADGTEMLYQPYQVEPDLPPPLPANYDAWKGSVTTSLDTLVSALLGPDDAQRLTDHAPADFYESLDFRLRALAFITGEIQ